MMEKEAPKVKLPVKVSRPLLIIAIGVGVAIFGFIFLRSFGRYLTGKVSDQLKMDEAYKMPQLPNVPGFQKLTIEKEMEVRIQRILNEILGPRKSVVRVSVILSPGIQNKEEIHTPKPISTKQEEKTRVSSERGVERKGTEEERQKLKRKMEKLPSIPEIEIREGENYFIYPGYPTLRDLTAKPLTRRVPFERGKERTGTQTTKEVSVTEYALDKKITETITPAGSIARITVFVLVDVIWKKTLTGKVRSVRRSEKELQQYRTLIESTIGYDSERGDRIEILNIPFRGARPAIEMMEKITTGITILILLPVLYFIVRTTLSFLRRRAQEKQEMLEIMRKEGEVEKERRAKEEREKRETIQMHQEQVFTIGRTHADICARIIRNWLT